MWKIKHMATIMPYVYTLPMAMVLVAFISQAEAPQVDLDFGVFLLNYEHGAHLVCVLILMIECCWHIVIYL